MSIKYTLLFLTLFVITSCDTNTKQEKEELDAVDELIKQDKLKVDSVMNKLDSFYNEEL
jgi:hypothetical protein